jgi:hypothetical protein
MAGWLQEASVWELHSPLLVLTGDADSIPLDHVRELSAVLGVAGSLARPSTGRRRSLQSAAPTAHGGRNCPWPPIRRRDWPQERHFQWQHQFRSGPPIRGWVGLGRVAGIQLCARRVDAILACRAWRGLLIQKNRCSGAFCLLAGRTGFGRDAGSYP